MGTRDDDFSNTSVRPSSASSRFSSYLSLDLQSGQMSNASQYLDSMVSPGPHSFSDASTYSMSFAASEAGGPFSMHYNAGEQQEPKSESKSSSKLLESEDSIRKPSPGIGSLPYLHLFRYADRVDWVLMVLGSVGAVLHGLVIPLGIYVISKIMTALGTNGLHSAQSYKEVIKGVLVMIYIAVQIPWLGFMEVGFWTITGDRQTGRIRAKYLRAMLRQEVGYYDTEMTTGEILHLISVDSMLLQDAMGERVSSFLHNVSTFIGGLAFMLVEVWQLALICVFLLPVTFTIAVTYTKIYTKFAVQAAGAYKTTDSLIEQTVSQIRTVYSYVGETKAGQALSQLLEMAVRLSRSGGLAKGFGLGITLALNNMQWAIMFWVGALLIADGQNIPPANIMACALTAVFTGPSLGVALRETETFAKGKVAAYRIFEIIERQPRIDSLSLAGDVLPSLKGEIDLSNVHFAYPARPDVPLFKNLSLRIPAGKTVALVGASGSGKSTVISLIERFYDPSSGVVKLDGVDIKTLQLKWLRSQTGLVGQEPVLFAASIKENILHGKEGATDQDVISASQAANAHSFISGLPLQYETQVGERGLQLSGGQKQRVAIARAVLKNPSILLLDEATSALDTESEQVVQQALNNLMQGRTTVVVAHRLSTIQHADLIAVFDRGQIAELGTHSELLSKGSSGIYYTLVNLQASSAQSYRATGSAAPSPARWSNVQASPLSSSYHASPAGTVLHRRSFHGGSESRRRSFHAGIEVGTWSGIYSPHSEMFSAAMDRPKFLASPALSEMLSPNLGPQYSAFSPLPVRQPVQPQPTSLEEMDDNKATQEPTLKKFPVGTALQFLKGKATLSVVALVASSVAGWFNPLFAVLSVRMLGLFFEPNITGPHLKSGVAKYCIVFVGLGFINLISTAAQQICSTTIGATVSKRMEEAAFKALLQNEVAWFDREENNSAAVTSRLSTDSAIVKIALTERVSCLVQYGTSLILAVVLAIAISWRMAIVALSAFPLAVFSGAMRNSFLTGALGGNSKLSQERSAQIAAEAVGNIRTVASLCLEEKLLSVFENQVKSGNKSRSRKSLLGGLMFGIAHCLTLIASGCCLLYGAYLIRKGQATFVTIVSVFQVVGHTAFHLLESLKIFPDLRKAKEAALSTFDIISRQSSIDPDSGKGGADDSGSAIAGTIELQNVFFSYPSRPDTPILQGMHLLIPGNSTTALVGPSGSGKSSVVALIERFYDPDRGRVLLDGKDITGLNLRRLRQHIALVQQEPALFSTTIRDNILYGRQGATEAEVVEAAKGANAHAFISGLPEGYDTEVGERGTQLSGGQKQRIAIARAILKNPKVLLLDEATSALDAESERVVQEALDRLMQGARTTLVIAHRLSTIQNAPQIAVVSQGQVVEKGTHAKLLRAKGVYAQLVQLQQLKS